MSSVVSPKSWSDPREIVLLILFVIVPLVVNAESEEAFLFIKLLMAEVMLVVLIGLTLFSKSNRSALRSIRFPVTFFMLIIAFCYFISMLFAAPFELSHGLPSIPKVYCCSSGSHLYFFILAFFCLVAWQRSDQINRRVLHIAVYTAAITAIYGIMQYIGVDPFKDVWVEESVETQRGIFSTFGNANMLSGYLIGLLPFLLLWFIEEKAPGRKYLYGFLLVLFSITIIVTGTRGAWIGAIVSLTILVFFLLRRQYIHGKQLLISVSILLVLALLLSFMVAVTNLFDEEESEKLFWNRMTSFFNTEDTSGRARLIAWDISLRMIGSQPFFGTGLGGFKHQYLYYRADFFNTKDRVDYVPIVAALNYTRTHNEYLQTLVEGGLVTALPLYGLIIFFFFAMYRLLSILPEEKFTTVAGSLAGFTAIALHGIFSFPLHLAPHGVLIIFLASLFSPYLTGKRELPQLITWGKKDSVILGVMGLLLLTMLVCLMVHGSYVFVGSAFADMNTKDARLALEGPKPDPDKTLLSCKKGLFYDPQYGPLYFYQAQAYQYKARLAKMQKNEREALDFFSKSSESCRKGLLNRTDAAMYVLWGLNLLETGKTKEAAEILTTATELDPASFNYLKMAGIAAYQAQDYEQALKHLQHARDLSDDDPVVHQHMAAIWQAKNNPSEAVIHLDALWRLRAELPKARINELNIVLSYADVHRQLGNYDVTLYLLQTMRDKYGDLPQIMTLWHRTEEEINR